ncbi:MAG TPA: SDR family oxidoreductase [Polyangiaceae bacterium]|nr:SDR family oxidoreductase [Polyangiaceae bacterium]
MEPSGKVVIVTGAASGIGRALAERFSREGVQGLVLADLHEDAVRRVGDPISAVSVRADVSVERDVQALVETAVGRFGRVDVFCSNAGIFVPGGAETLDADWRRILDVNVMAHVYAARAVVPAMLERGEGYFLSTVSAAGLLSQIGSAPYAVTKHAALAFSEWLSITYGDRGLRVSAICPQGVRTGMLDVGSGPAFLLEGALEAEAVAEAAIQGMRREEFLILPHPEVRTYFERKGADYERWLRGMRKLRAKVEAG